MKALLIALTALTATPAGAAWITADVYPHSAGYYSGTPDGVPANQIIEIWFGWGGKVYRRFFRGDVSDTTQALAVALAGLPNRPYRIDIMWEIQFNPDQGPRDGLARRIMTKYVPTWDDPHPEPTTQVVQTEQVEPLGFGVEREANWARTMRMNAVNRLMIGGAR